MDKKPLLIKSLAKILDSYLTEINAAVSRHESPSVTIKADGSPVTELDIELSQIFEKIIQTHFPQFNFYSEENFSHWRFPLCALDPLDGTREYIQGRDQWVISLALFEDEDFSGKGWIYNPIKKEIFEMGTKLKFSKKTIYLGEVSISEWHNQLFEHKETECFKLVPVGSIAYKLARLSAGKSDFVISLRQKNIWDIAAGTILCHQSGIKFYSNGIEVKKVQKVYDPPLIWCHEELFSELSKIYF